MILPLESASYIYNLSVPKASATKTLLKRVNSNHTEISGVYKVLGESHDYDEKWNVMWEMHVSDLASNPKRYSQSSILSFVYSSKQAAQHSSIQAFFHSPFNLVIYMVWVMLAIVQCGMEFAYMTNLLLPKLTLSTALSTTASTTISATLSNTIITSYHVYLSTLLAQFSCLLPECWVFAKIMIICSVILLRVRCATLVPL